MFHCGCERETSVLARWQLISKGGFLCAGGNSGITGSTYHVEAYSSIVLIQKPQ